MSDRTGVKTVSLVKCDNYGRSQVYEAVKKSIELLGGLGSSFPRDRKCF